MKIKNLNSKLKSSVVVLVLGISLAAGITFASVAWVAQWQGTGWISDGSVIDASKMKDNFDNLKRLGWRASSETNTIFRPHGRVGIGTASPTTKLDVAGHIRTTNQVRANRFCDVNGENCFKAEDVINLLNPPLPPVPIVPRFRTGGVYGSCFSWHTGTGDDLRCSGVVFPAICGTHSCACAGGFSRVGNSGACVKN